MILLAMSVAIATLFGAAVPALAATPPSSRLLWADEFDGSAGSSAWARLTPWNTQYTTGELEYYDADNVSFSDGKMYLTSEERSVGGHSYASGIVTSLNRDKFSYGYFEIRAELPKGQGVWPAFWLTNDSTLEIDVFEMLGHKPDRQYMTLHRNDKTIYQGVYNGPDYSAGYHTYAVDWQPTYVHWYIDGVLRASYNHKMPADPLWICLNTAVGGVWPGSPDASTKFPQSYDIDYVRVFDKMPAASLSARSPDQQAKAVAGSTLQGKPAPLPPAAQAQTSTPSTTTIWAQVTTPTPAATPTPATSTGRTLVARADAYATNACSSRETVVTATVLINKRRLRSLRGIALTPASEASVPRASFSAASADGGPTGSDSGLAMRVSATEFTATLSVR